MTAASHAAEFMHHPHPCEVCYVFLLLCILGRYDLERVSDISERKADALTGKIAFLQVIRTRIEVVKVLHLYLAMFIAPAVQNCSL
jgi:hypothetical protein